LLYGDGIVHSASLTVPHPRMWQRAFVLAPLAEIAPQRVPTEILRAALDQAIERIGW
jgi:2-amino-4-hydroxy-6-hydroxymethyldihydropteridine diphosphokinase